MKQKIQKYKFYIGAIILIGILFSVFTLNTSVSKSATSEVKKATNNEQVQKVWDKYINEIDSKNGQEKLIKAVKEKLSTMDLSDEEIEHWHTLFRGFSDITPSLNIIVIPDLSHRINEIPETENYDKAIISDIYTIFFQKAKSHKSTDKLVIEVTDNAQASGLFGQIAENLTIDMTDRKNNENAKKYIESKEQNFKTNIDQLYSEAKKSTRGADYVYYFNRIAPSRIKKSTIETQYINKIIILTDGYLETSDRTYTRIDNSLKPIVHNNGNLEQAIADKNWNIPKNRYTFPNTEILVLEITERPDGIMWHKEILMQYWKDWFKSMGIKNIHNDNFFQLHNHNMNETRNLIHKFLK